MPKISLFIYFYQSSCLYLEIMLIVKMYGNVWFVIPLLSVNKLINTYSDSVNDAMGCLGYVTTRATGLEP